MIILLQLNQIWRYEMPLSRPAGKWRANISGGDPSSGLKESKGHRRWSSGIGKYGGGRGSDRWRQQKAADSGI